MISFQKLFGSVKDSFSIQEAIWQRPVTSVFEQPEGRHIWKIKWPDISSQNYLEYLSDDEYRKILCYRNPEDRNKKIISRGILKELCSKYCNVAPKTLTLETNPYGKPCFSNLYNHLQFNISHSTGFILIAFDFKGRAIGIDIEKNNLLFNFLEIADSYFSETEKKSLACDSPAQQFFKIWTRKEALVKAIGTGLTDEILQENVLKEKILLDQKYYLKSFMSSSNHLFSIAGTDPLEDLYFYEY